MSFSRINVSHFLVELIANLRCYFHFVSHRKANVSLLDLPQIVGVQDTSLGRSPL